MTHNLLQQDRSRITAAITAHACITCSYLNPDSYLSDLCPQLRIPATTPGSRAPTSGAVLELCRPSPKLHKDDCYLYAADCMHARTERHFHSANCHDTAFLLLQDLVSTCHLSVNNDVPSAYEQICMTWLLCHHPPTPFRSLNAVSASHGRCIPGRQLGDSCNSFHKTT